MGLLAARSLEPHQDAASRPGCGRDRSQKTTWSDVLLVSPRCISVEREDTIATLTRQVRATQRRWRISPKLDEAGGMQWMMQIADCWFGDVGLTPSLARERSGGRVSETHLEKGTKEQLCQGLGAANNLDPLQHRPKAPVADRV